MPRTVLMLFLAIISLILCACAVTQRPVTAAYIGDAQDGPLIIGDTAVPLAQKPKPLTPESPGIVVYAANGAVIDASNAAEGYVTVKYSGDSDRAKVRVTRRGQTAYTYNLRTDGHSEVFPLTGGNGDYEISVFNRLYDNQFAQALVQNVSVELRDAALPFLYPSQFVNFNAGSAAVAKSIELAGGADSDLAVVSNIYNFIIGTIVYDTEKAKLGAEGQLGGYVADVDGTLSAGKGICFDYAALMTAMLRAQMVPTRMEFGYVTGGAYHAWVSTYITDVGWVNGVIRFDGKNWVLMDPTFASSGGANSQYVGSGTEYKMVYRY
jgi:transglutaminase-like putative cysteine protease